MKACILLAYRASIADISEDENKESLMVTASEERVMAMALGHDKYHSVLASIYTMRSDVVPTIRNVAWRVWKAVVQVRQRDGCCCVVIHWCLLKHRTRRVRYAPSSLC